MEIQKTHGRYPYSALIERDDFVWPSGKRLAFYIALNLEHFSFAEGMGAKLAGGDRHEPDVLNYAWRDYGNRCGVWYLHELFSELDCPLALLVNSSIYHYCPQVVEKYRELPVEIVAHGRTNAEAQGHLNKAEEWQLITETTDVICEHEEKRPAGWLGPWISESHDTPDLLKKAGYSYMLDWCHDDQPTWFETEHGPILNIPYSQEVNDIPTIIPNGASAKEFSEMIIDNFDEMLLQSKKRSLVFGLSLHPYIVGQPFRLKHLRVALQHILQHNNEIWLTTPGEIASLYQARDLDVS